VAEEFTCAVEDAQYRSACKDLPKYSGSRYCVLHEPDEAKNKEAFEEAKKSKLDRKDYDFSGTVFPEGTADFEGFEFDADANFAGATFSGVNTRFNGAAFIGEADFTEATFSAVLTYFNATFSGVNTRFNGATFSGERTDFERATFSGELTDFSGATFSALNTRFDFTQFGSAETEFQEATFVKEVAFAVATFREKVAFWGSKENWAFDSQAWARFDRFRIDRPELLTFNHVLLHPGWFINADVRKVDFTDVQWYGMPSGIEEGTLEEEIAALTKRGVESPHALLSQACQRLSANAEGNREYPLANEFQYWSMNALRLESWSVLYEALLKEEVRRDIEEWVCPVSTDSLPLGHSISSQSNLFVL